MTALDKLNEIDRRHEVVRTLRHALAEGLGWTGAPRDVADLVAYLDGVEATQRAATQVANRAMGAAHAATDLLADPLARATATGRFRDMPRWVRALLEEFREDHVEAGRDAARRAVATAMRGVVFDERAGPGMPSVRDPGPAELRKALEEARARFPRDAAVLSARPPEGLTSQEVLDAWLEGFDSEALLAATSESKERAR